LDERGRSPQGFRGFCGIRRPKRGKTQLNEALSHYLFRHFSQPDVFIVPGNAASPAVAPLAVVGLNLLVGSFALFQQKLLRDTNVDELPGEHFVERAALGFNIPMASNGTNQHTWTAAERVEFQKALSEIHATAWGYCSTSTQAELSVLFELTTVTKKLRRIAQLDLKTLADSARQIRPSWVAVTFMNYLFPEWWYRAPEHLTSEMTRALGKIEGTCNTSVKLVSFGPEDRHILSF
jgi:hypothetical protein